MLPRTHLARVAVALTLLLVPACGSDEDDAAEPTTVPPTVELPSLDPDLLAGPLPPAQAIDLEPLYADALAAAGVRLADRGGLIDRRGGRYDPSPQGRHLALYVEPVGERSPAQYTQGLFVLTELFATDVFERWPELTTFDVCQEPPQALDPQPEPTPVTQIELSRAQARRLDFSRLTLTDLLKASVAEPPGIRIVVSSLVEGESSYQEALRDAGVI